MRLAFSNLAAPGWSLERALAAVHEHGYDGIELRLLDGEPIDPLTLSDAGRSAARAALAAAGVPLVCLDTSIRLADDFEEPLQAALALAGEWGAPVVRVFGGTFDVDDVADRIAGVLSDATVTVALETHDDASSSVAVARLLDAVDHPCLGALWDLHHPYRVGESPEDVLANLDGRIALVHVKDAVRRGDDWQLVPLGEGEVPVRESLAALGRAGYDGWISVEWEKRWHPELAEPEVALPQHSELLRRWLAS